jgi:hypothetical protein
MALNFLYGVVPLVAVIVAGGPLVVLHCNNGAVLTSLFLAVVVAIYIGDASATKLGLFENSSL